MRVVKGSDLIVSKRVAVLKIKPKRGQSQALTQCLRASAFIPIFSSRGG